MSESELNTKIHVDAAKQEITLFRNNVGVGYSGDVVNKSEEYITLRNWRMIRFGLFKGSSDYIGWKKIRIIPEMVGRVLAIFTAVENKSKRGRVSKEQNTFLTNLEKSGGLAIVARDTADLHDGIKSWMNKKS